MKKVGEDIEALRFNTAISQLMIFVNAVMQQEGRPRRLLEPFVKLLSPFAPHLAEELWSTLGHESTITYEPWPEFDAAMLQASTVEVVVQVNGKVRSRLSVAVDAPDAELEARARADEAVRKHIDGKNVLKAIVVKNKLVNLVVQ